MTKIIPAILALDKDSYRKQIQKVEKFVEVVHVDFMDGIFVKNKTVTLQEIGQLGCQASRVAHLMIVGSVDLIPLLPVYGFKGVVIQAESFSDNSDLARAIMIARRNELETAIALNPETNENQIKTLIDNLDFLQLMTVHPGLAGQPIISSMKEKIRRIKKRYPKTLIAVDGGVKEDNIADLYQAGARIFIIGSAIFRNNPATQISRFHSIISQLENSPKQST